MAVQLIILKICNAFATIEPENRIDADIKIFPFGIRTMKIRLTIPSPFRLTNTTFTPNGSENSCQGFFQGGAGGGIRPPLDFGCPPSLLSELY